MATNASKICKGLRLPTSPISAPELVRLDHSDLAKRRNRPGEKRARRAARAAAVIEASASHKGAAVVPSAEGTDCDGAEEAKEGEEPTTPITYQYRPFFASPGVYPPDWRTGGRWKLLFERPKVSPLGTVVVLCSNIECNKEEIVNVTASTPKLSCTACGKPVVKTHVQYFEPQVPTVECDGVEA